MGGGVGGQGYFWKAPKEKCGSFHSAGARMEKMALRCRGRACVEHALIKTRLLKEAWTRVAERAVRRVLGTFHTPPRVRINIHHSP